MRIHVLGIGGTFMGSLALLARQAGHEVSGCDANVYPPMSELLEAERIDWIEGYGAEQADLPVDVFVVGNAISRGNPLLEEILDRGLPYVSGPQWLAEHILPGRWVLAVAGTHGKTTTSSMLAWILQANGLAPGFLIGGVPGNFARSAQLGTSPFFVIEADEYDTAFCDKRAKFVHYRPRTAILNNLEFDHADIYPDLAAIEAQFHHLVRTMPRSGRIVALENEAALDRVLARGCWSQVERFGLAPGEGAAWTVAVFADGAAAGFFLEGRSLGEMTLPLPGRHNALNALAAIAAARHAGVRPQEALAALAEFRGVRRRLQLRGEVAGVTVYDDFAHHPTALRETIAALRPRVPRRLIAVFEPRSNTMKLGVMRAALPGALAGADLVHCYAKGLGWDAREALAPLGARVTVGEEMGTFVAGIVAQARPGDAILVMSNGGFEGIHERLLAALAARGEAA
jgi:UDP-N-acetylmuramate: L-alanyl-gamma-D-glutamyl-meso-diaminopimelate ligase